MEVQHGEDSTPWQRPRGKQGHTGDDDREDQRGQNRGKDGYDNKVQMTRQVISCAGCQKFLSNTSWWYE